MADNHFPLRDRSQERWPRHDPGGEIQYLLRAEGQILQSISARMPLAEILHKICNALNSEIGNMISLVSLPNDDATGLATIVKSATLFGLYKFCSARVEDGNDKSLGSLEMYSCVPRRPFLSEIQLIERAACLAAIAIKHHRQEDNHSESCSTTLKREVLI
jgi:hypothetical protein